MSISAHRDRIAASSIAVCYVMTLLVCCNSQEVHAQSVSDNESARFHLASGIREQCLRIYREVLNSDDFWPAMHAAEALTDVGFGEEVREVLLPKLAVESNDQKRCGLARELIRTGDRTKVTILLDIVADENSNGRVHAAESLYKVAMVGNGQALRAILDNSNDTQLQLMAAGALARCGSIGALEFIRNRLDSEPADVARTAAWLLGDLGDASDIKSLQTAAVGAAAPTPRCFFEHALAELGDESGQEALRRNLADADPAVRAYAAASAGRIGDLQSIGQLARLLENSVPDVQVRAAQALIGISNPPPADRLAEVINDVYIANDAHPRYSEGSIVELTDGSLLYATTEFAGGSSDFASARIVSRTSHDGGRTWDKQRVLQENIGEKNVMSVTLRWLASPVTSETPLGMFYLVKNAHDDLKAYVRTSTDNGQTFGKPTLISSNPGYHVMNNDRVTLLSSGRLLAPLATTSNIGSENHFVSSCYISDDQGKTWRAGVWEVDLPQRGAMEPEVIEMDDGKVAMIMRTQLGHIAIAYSPDKGDTWTKPVAWSVKAPEAPATLRRIPATGDLLLIWNNVYEEGEDHGGRRTPLTAAVSSDGGKTWSHVRNLETRSDQTYAYASVVFVNDRAVMTYYVRDDRSGWISSRFRSLPISWFYQPVPVEATATNQ